MSRWWAWRPGKLTAQRARDVIYRAVLRLADERAAEDARLCASELVANAELHGKGCIRLSLYVRPGGLLCAVRDDGPMSEWRETHAPDPWRGLQLVQSLADSVGVCSEGRGKVAWFELRGGL